MVSMEVKSADYAQIKAWLDLWSKCVADVDFESAREMFDENVIGFGTWMDTIEGRDNLIENQWKSIWPKITDFQFLTDTLEVQVSPDRLFAIAILVWQSTGFHQSGEPYDRPGRATVSLRRNSLGSSWQGIHTHLSLYRNVPQKSYSPLSRIRKVDT